MATRKTTGGPAAGETGQPMTDMQAAMLPMAGLGPAFMEAMQDYMAASQAFLTHRMSSDMQLPQELMGCQDLQQVQEVQGRFVEQAMQDYREQAGRMAEIGQRFLDAMMHPPKT